MKIVESSSHTLDVNDSTNISGPLSVSGTISVGGQFSLGNIILTERIETTQLGRGTLISKSLYQSLYPRYYSAFYNFLNYVLHIA